MTATKSQKRSRVAKEIAVKVIKKMSHKQDGYLHGYTATEHNRLYHQARFLEDHVFAGVDFSGCKNIIEIGSGVGAQTEILHNRFPKLKIACIDSSREQVTKARAQLAGPIGKGLVSVTQTDARSLPFQKGSFEGAFITWFLEHVSNPVGILKETKRVMAINAVIHINEVFNHSFFTDPFGPATQEYWNAFNEHQSSLKGDPFVGAKLGNYLQKAGFKDISTNFSYWLLDSRHPKFRAEFLSYWIDLLLSGSAELVKSKKVSKKLVLKMTAELNSLRKNPDSVFFLGFVKAVAYV